MTFPSPIAFWIQAGPLGAWPVRWYGVSYAVGIILAWCYVKRCVNFGKFPPLSSQHLEGFLSWGMLGVVVGGRLGHVFFYYPSYYLHHPLEIFKVWEGGMAFHGGLLGVIAALFFYCRAHRIPFLTFADAWACGAPIGFFFGRLANFVNQELYGRMTQKPWGIIFPTVDAHPRHPSQLYEAGLEGVCLFILLFFFTWKSKASQRHGFLSGLFLTGYGCARWVTEYYREALEVSEWMGGLPLGQIYSLPLIIGGILLCLKSQKLSSRQYED